MKSDWKNCILGDCLQIVKTSVMPKEQTMYSCFSLPAFDNSRTPEILDGKDIKSSKFVLTENTILFNKLNPKFRRIWNVHSLDQTINPIASTEFLPLKVNSNISQDFLYYYISSPSFTALMDGIKTGTSNSQQRIDWRLFLRQPIYLPPSHTQCKIARILTLIDDKIHLNQQINKNLEQQALAIFRQYFMDFAPYGGVAPSDWMEVSLDDVCIRITDGSHYSPADSPDSPYPMYSVKDMETYGFNSSTCKHITEDEFRKMKKSDCVPLLNDILVAKDGSYLKEIFICSEEKEEAILSSIAIFRPNTSVIMPEILLYLLKQSSVRKDVGDNYVSGSALPRIVLKDFKKYRLTLPTMNEQLKIGSVLHAIRMQTKANIDEIQRLSSIRDTLLPQLMSGNLDVSALDI